MLCEDFDNCGVDFALLELIDFLVLLVNNIVKLFQTDFAVPALVF